MNNDSNTNNVVDPLNYLHSEAFCHLISFLPPSSIATSTAVSQFWREVIQFNPSLHNEVDLLNPDGSSHVVIVMAHFNRLSHLARHNLVKISLDLSSFRTEFTRLRKENESIRLTVFKALNLQLYRSTLREIKLVVDDKDGAGPFIIQLINQDL